MVTVRIFMLNIGCRCILALHRAIRSFSRWLFRMTLPPNFTNMLYKRWYIKRQELEHTA